MNKTFTNAKSTFSYYFTLQNIKIIQTTCQQTSDIWTELVCNIFICDVILNEHDWMILFFELNGINENNSFTKYLFTMLFWMNMIVMILSFELNGINEINSFTKYLFVMLFWMCMSVMILFFHLNGINEISSPTKYLFVMWFWIHMTVMI